MSDLRSYISTLNTDLTNAKTAVSKVEASWGNLQGFLRPTIIGVTSGSISAKQGTSVAMCVQATTNYGTLKYQWSRDNVVLGAQTNSTLSLNKVSTSDSGAYFVTVTNDFVSVSAPAAILLVESQTTSSNNNTGSSNNTTGSNVNTGSNTTGSNVNTGSTNIVSSSLSIIGLSPVIPIGTNAVVSVNLNGGIDPNTTTFLWEASNQEPVIGTSFVLNPSIAGPQWIELEVDTIDGKRLYATASYIAQLPVINVIENYNVTGNSAVKSWYKLDGTLVDSMNTSPVMKLNGNAKFDNQTFIWSNRVGGQCIVLNGISDYLTVTLPSTLFPSTTKSISLEGMFNIKNFVPNGVGNGKLFRFDKNWNAYFGIDQDMWQGISIHTYNGTLMNGTQIMSIIPLNTWVQMKMLIDNNGYYFFVNGTQIATQTVTNNLSTWLTNNIPIQIGQFTGWVDEIVLKVS